MQLRIGCSGFYYKEWKDVFYPPKLPQRRWFEYYSTKFNTLELNVTFYRFPKLDFLQNWYDKSPSGFCFSVKVPRAITHYKKFVETEELLADFCTTIKEGLKEKLGPVLFQLPPSIQYSEEQLQKIVEAVNPDFTNVIEFRHSSWWNKNVYDELAKHNISFCGISHPKLSDEVIASTGVLYYRFHGVPRLYYSEYPAEQIEAFAQEIKKHPKLEKAFIYFNNTAGIGAINNAEYLKKLLSV